MQSSLRTKCVSETILPDTIPDGITYKGHRENLTGVCKVRVHCLSLLLVFTVATHIHTMAQILIRS